MCFAPLCNRASSAVRQKRSRRKSMVRNVNDIIRSLPVRRRRKIEKHGAQLIGSLRNREHNRRMKCGE